MPNSTERAVELDRTTCLQLLAEVVVGRVVFTTAAMPAAAPVVYVLDGEEVVFRAATGSTLAGIDGSVVGFQADRIDVVGDAGWSVLGVGHAYAVRDPHRLAELASRFPASGPTGDRRAVICIPLQQLSGRLLLPVGSHAHACLRRGPTNREGEDGQADRHEGRRHLLW
jgi:hypothetical protein